MVKRTNLVPFPAPLKVERHPPDESGVPTLDLICPPPAAALNVEDFAKTHGEAGVRAMAELAEKEARVAALVEGGCTFDAAVLSVFGDEAVPLGIVLPVDRPVEV